MLKAKCRKRSCSRNFESPRFHGIVQNLFKKFGYITCSSLDTNVFFVPSFVAVGKNETYNYADIMKSLKLGSSVEFEAAEQAEQNGCRWIATKVSWTSHLNFSYLDIESLQIWLVDDPIDKCEGLSDSPVIINSGYSSDSELNAETTDNWTASSHESDDNSCDEEELEFLPEYRLFSKHYDDFIKDLGIDWHWNSLDWCLNGFRKV